MLVMEDTDETDSCEAAYQHDSRSKIFPTKDPEHVWSDSGHLFNTVTKLVCPKDPANDHSLEEADPQ